MYSGSGPICAIAPDLRRGGFIGLGGSVWVVVVDPTVAIVELLLRPVCAGADDGTLPAAAMLVDGVCRSVMSSGEAEESNDDDEPRSSCTGPSGASRKIDPALLIDEPEGVGTPIPYGSVPSSTSLNSGFRFIFFFFALSHCFRPLFPNGLARTPSYEAVPGSSWSERPSAVRQRGAPRPKRGTDKCIVSSPL
jgi:hypothetical protein